MLSLQTEEKRSFFKRFDLLFAGNILLLHIIGILILYSATHGLQSSNINALFKSQILWSFIVWGLFLFLTVLNYKFLKHFCYWFYTANVLALILVFFKGRSFYGAQRWLDLGFFHFQPSETMKVSLLLVLAYEFSRRNFHKNLGLKALSKPLILILIPFLLIVSQPDLGTAMILLATGGSLTLFMKVKKSILLGVFAIALVSLPFIWNYGLKTYQKNRILTFINPNKDPRGMGYNSIQSKIAVGSGAFWGKGFLEGTQSQLAFLPERHTDFIYSVLSEEFGFAGSFITFLAFVFLIIQLLQISSYSRDPFGVLLVFGGVFYIFWHVFVNIGMVLGLLPIVGAPLPLLSYGGSNLVTTMFFLGMASSVSYRRYIF